ncbi:unnamed protein product, partial [Nesidiocoris tenuis]
MFGTKKRKFPSFERYLGTSDHSFVLAGKKVLLENDQHYLPVLQAVNLEWYEKEKTRPLLILSGHFLKKRFSENGEKSGVVGPRAFLTVIIHIRRHKRRGGPRYPQSVHPLPHGRKW